MGRFEKLMSCTVMNNEIMCHDRWFVWVFVDLPEQRCVYNLEMSWWL